MALEVTGHPLRSLGTCLLLVAAAACRTAEVSHRPGGPAGDHTALIEAVSRDRDAVLAQRRAAEDGDPVSQSALGLMYLLGRGMPRHDGAAASWFERAALQGDPAGQYYLGLLFLEGRGVPKSIDLAAVWLRRAKEQDNGRARRSFYALYDVVTDLPDEVTGVATWFRRTAEGGLPYAQLALARLRVLEWQSGTDPSEGERGETIEWLRRAAEQDYPDAQLALAASLSDTGAQEEAALWLLQASQAGLPAAQRELGLAYVAGRGVRRDPVQAHAWLNLATAAGDEKAVEPFDAVQAQLSPSQLAEAERLALEWHERIIARSLAMPASAHRP